MLKRDGTNRRSKARQLVGGFYIKVHVCSLAHPVERFAHEIHNPTVLGGHLHEGYIGIQAKR